VLESVGGDRDAGLVFFKTAAIPMSMLMLFLIYWLLPNHKIPCGASSPPPSWWAWPWSC